MIYPLVGQCISAQLGGRRGAGGVFHLLKHGVQASPRRAAQPHRLVFAINGPEPLSLLRYRKSFACYTDRCSDYTGEDGTLS
jgi:hypothetical protein